MKQLKIRSYLIITVLIFTVVKGSAQNVMPDVLLKGRLNEQINYLDEHTRIYEDYRAIREDMFQKLKSNVADTVKSVYATIGNLNKKVADLKRTIDTLNSSVGTVKTDLDSMTKTKNSIKVLGMEINKSAYNRIMWTLVLGLAILLLGGFIIFKRNMDTTSNTKKELQDLKNEFEAYRKSSREAREKMTMDHFNEIKRLRGA